MAKKPVKTSVLAGKPDAYQQALQQRQNIVQQQAQEKKANTGGWFQGTQSSTKRIPLGDANQQKLQGDIGKRVQQALPYYNLPGNKNASFEPYAQLARQANQKSQQSLAERFHGLTGSGFGPASSAFQGLSESQAGFEAQLAAAQAEYDMLNQNNQTQNFNTLAGLASTPQYGYEHTPGQPSYFNQLAHAAIPSLAEAGVGYLTGGPIGAAVGGIHGALSNLRGPENINKSKGTPLYDNYQTASQQRYDNALASESGASGFTGRNNPYAPGSTSQQGQQNNPQNMQRIYQLLASQYTRR